MSLANGAISFSVAFLDKEKNRMDKVTGKKKVAYYYLLSLGDKDISPESTL